MRAALVHELEPGADQSLGVMTVLQLVQVHRLVFHRAPHPLDEDVALVAVSPVHGAERTGRTQLVGEGDAGELRALVGVVADMVEISP